LKESVSHEPTTAAGDRAPVLDEPADEPEPNAARAQAHPMREVER
jgi:hypothetical protein